MNTRNKITSKIFSMSGLLFFSNQLLASEGGEEKLDVMHHVYDSHVLEIPFIGEIHLPHLEIAGVDVSITKHIVMMWIVFALLILLAIRVKSAYTKLGSTQAPKGFMNFIEAVVSFVKDDIVKVYIGEEKEKIYTPYLLTVFFFIICCNLLGLIPVASTATGNLAVTMTLAVFTFIITQVSAIKTHGFGGWAAHFTGGTPVGLWLIMIPVEIIGMFVKPFALMVRLFANMTAGHIALGTLIGLIFIFKSWGIVPFSIAISVAIYALELFVALVQAYVFTLLSALFIGIAIQKHEHHEEHQH